MPTKQPKDKKKSPESPAAEPKSNASAAGEIPIYDPVEAKTAFEALAERRKALKDSDLASIRLDVKLAALAGLVVYAFATTEPLYSRFQKLHSIDEFDISNLDRLKDACFAVMYAYDEAAAAGALETDVKVPISFVKEGLEVEGRMQTNAEHHCKNDAEIKPELDRLRPGSGHRDLADDLLGYARIYEKRFDILSTDVTYYRSTDVADARRIAGKILALYMAAMSPKERVAYDALVQSWTLLLLMYDKVQIAGLFLLRDDSQKNARFPSLFAAGRPGIGRPKKAKEDEVVDQSASPPVDASKDQPQ